MVQTFGDDQLRGTFIGEQAEVLADLGQDLLTFPPT